VRQPADRDRRGEAGSPFTPWAGAIGAALASILQQQGLGNSLRFDCAIDAPWWGILTGVVALVVIAIGALISGRVFRAHADASNQDSTPRFIAGLSLLASALAIGVVLFMTLAAIMVPPCPP
jgi:drug/metabolite transporter (DMT)-like permease